MISGAALDVWYNYNPEKDKHGKEYPYNYPFHKLVVRCINYGSSNKFSELNLLKLDSNWAVGNDPG